jgi:hypothetical protein
MTAQSERLADRRRWNANLVAQRHHSPGFLHDPTRFVASHVAPQQLLRSF